MGLFDDLWGQDDPPPRQTRRLRGLQQFDDAWGDDTGVVTHREETEEQRIERERVARERVLAFEREKRRGQESRFTTFGPPSPVSPKPDPFAPPSPVLPRNAPRPEPWPTGPSRLDRAVDPSTPTTVLQELGLRNRSPQDPLDELATMAADAPRTVRGFVDEQIEHPWESAKALGKNIATAPFRLGEAAATAFPIFGGARTMGDDGRDIGPFHVRPIHAPEAAFAGLDLATMTIPAVRGISGATERGFSRLAANAAGVAGKVGRTIAEQGAKPAFTVGGVIDAGRSLAREQADVWKRGDWNLRSGDGGAVQVPVLEAARARAGAARDMKRRVGTRLLGPGQESPLQGPGIAQPGFREVAEVDPTRMLPETTTPMGRSTGRLADAKLRETRQTALDAEEERKAIQDEQRQAPYVIPPGERNYDLTHDNGQFLYARDKKGTLRRNLGKVHDDGLFQEIADLHDANAAESGVAPSVRMQEGAGTTGGKGAGGYDPVMITDPKPAGRVKARLKAVERMTAELRTRGHSAQAIEDGIFSRMMNDDTSFGPHEGLWPDEGTSDAGSIGNRPGYTAAGQLGIILAPGAGAVAGAALAPEGKKREGAVTGAVAALGLAALGARGLRNAAVGSAARTERAALDAETLWRKHAGIEGHETPAHIDADLPPAERHAAIGALKDDEPYFVRGKDGEIQDAGRGNRPGAIGNNINANIQARRAALGPIGHPAVQQVLGTIAHGNRPALAPAEALSTAEQLYTRGVDELYPLRKMGRATEGTERLSNVATQGAGWPGMARVHAEEHLKPILTRVAGKEREVMALAKAQRDLDLRARGLEKTDTPPAVSQAAVTVLEADPVVKQGAKDLQKYFRGLLDVRLREGIIDQAQYNGIVATGDFYTPFAREFAVPEVGGAGGGAAGGKRMNRTTGVRRMDTGKARSKTVDPFETAHQATFGTMQAVAKQRVTNIVGDLVGRFPAEAAPFVKQVASDAAAAKEGAVIVEPIVNGRRVRLQVTDPDMARAWSAYDRPTQSLFTKLGGAFKRVLQAGVTGDPGFMAANVTRDVVQRTTQVPFTARQGMAAGVGAVAGALSGDDTDTPATKILRVLAGAGTGAAFARLAPAVAANVRALADITKGAPIYKQFLKDGGEMFGLYPRSQADARKALDRLRKSGVSLSDVVSPSSWWEGLQWVGSATEQATRLAEYKVAKAGGASAAEAVGRSRDVSLDFSKQGSQTKPYSAVTAFWNPTVQGWDKLVRQLKDPKMVAATATTITAPSVALWMVNKDNPEYQDRPLWEKNMFWLLPKGGEGGFWRVPKPFQLGFLFGSVPERFLDYMHDHDAERLGASLKDITGSSFEGILPLPTAVTPLVENLTNYDFFRQRPVVSRPDLPAELQSDDRTSAVALGVSHLLGVSPQKTDNLLRDYTGSLGGLALDATSALARASGLDSRAAPVDPTTPIVGRFSTKATSQPEAEAQFRRKHDALSAIYRGGNELVHRAERSESPADLAAVHAYAEEHRDDLMEYERLRPLKTAFDAAADARREIRANTTLSVEQKREQLAGIESRLRAFIEARR